MMIAMVGAWYSLKLLFQDKPKLRVMGLYGCTQKTISSKCRLTALVFEASDMALTLAFARLYLVGVPLITALYENNPNIGMYTLPLIIYYPMQVVIGTMLVSRLQAFIRNETARLAGTEADDSMDDEDDDVEFAEGYGDDLERGNLPIVAGESCRVEDVSIMPVAQLVLDDNPELGYIEDDVTDEPLGELETVPIGSSSIRVNDDES